VGIDAALMRRAAFLDRDGVINRALVRDRRPYPPATLAELEILPGVPRALERLRAAGYVNIVITNQPDVARRNIERSAVEAIHRRLQDRLATDAFYTCWHDDADNCACRKPRPGLLHQAASEHNIDLGGSIMIGDRWRDIAAGQKAGCRTVWIRHGYDEPEPTGMDFVSASLAEAVDWILQSGGTK
jgi:D-glycero-D-manno-heptose 1,7-bisphosphate phosphatase